MASNCTENCSSRNSKALLTTLKNEGKSKGANSLDSFLKNEKVTVDFGAREEYQMTVDEANGHYLAHHFPDLGEASYCCPSIFKYKHPGEPLGSEENNTVGETKKEVTFATLLRERRGELAEEETVEKFFTMLNKYDIPAFVIHGYNWKAQYLNNLKSEERVTQN
ncbi:hypothetical protein HOLleu_04558 [Holothuria leucospilota]|uniref:Uncharacterized protein n=1 Tax=Holothuria leucospilota TaxID=206669 RepID=A0A9Q1CU91_HOLLE|nr:hypothetical protein HOLleu_04558 [Holothuria leucospilota]